MGTFEETRYIANTVIPENVDSAASQAGSAIGGVEWGIWIVMIALLLGVIIFLYRKYGLLQRNMEQYLQIVDEIGSASNSMSVEKVFEDICRMSNSEYLAVYVRRGDWYGLSFEINLTPDKKNTSIPLLLNPAEASLKGSKSGNFTIIPFTDKSKQNLIRFYTRDQTFKDDLIRRIDVVFANAIKLHSLLSMEHSNAHQSRIATISTQLSTSFLSLQYDREKLFYFVSNIIMKAVSAQEVVVIDDRAGSTFRYGKYSPNAYSKEFYIHHSGCRMNVMTSVALDSIQMNTIGKFIDSTYSLFVHEEENRKHAEQFLEFLIHSNNAMELEFTYFHHHSEMVECVALEIANRLQLDAETIKNLEIAAKIHDIGMIADMSFSLDKQDKLSTKEMDTIRNHPHYGSIIVEPLNHMYDISELIKLHHERYDGQGYPLGLMGDEIPLTAYILGFAEHFIGLISDRSYRKGKHYDEASKEVKKLSSQAFHPVVIRTFEQAESTIFELLRRFNPELHR